MKQGKVKQLINIAAAAAILEMIICCPAALASRGSANYRISADVLNAGGSDASSASYLLHSATGQRGPAGKSKSISFYLKAGYIYQLSTYVINPPLSISEPPESELSESAHPESGPSGTAPSGSAPSGSIPPESDLSESTPSESEASGSEPSESEPSGSAPTESEPSESEPPACEPNEIKPVPTPLPPSTSPSAPIPNFIDLEVMASADGDERLESGEALVLSWKAHAEEFNYINVPLAIYLGAILRPAAADRAGTVDDVFAGGPVYIFGPGMTGPCPYRPESLKPTFSGVSFPAVPEQGELTFTVPPGIGEELVFCAAFVNLYTGEFVNPQAPVEFSNPSVLPR